MASPAKRRRLGRLSELSASLWEEVQRAVVRLRGTTVLRTPLIESPAVAEEVRKLLPAGAAPPRIFLKLESEQVTGSFKARGAMNKVKALLERGCKGVVTASTGNHGAACAHAMVHTRCMDTVKAEIVLPETAAQGKVQKLRSLGVPIRLHGRDAVAAETNARETAERSGATFISPYNDPEVVGGQGTIGVEIAEQFRAATGGEAPDCVLVPVGGGGMISGIAVALRHLCPSTEVVGAAPVVNACMKDSLEKGRLLSDQEFDGSRDTFSDGTAGGIEAGSITFPVCQELCPRQMGVSEFGIADAVRLLFHAHHKVIEGAAGTGIAALMSDPQRYAGRAVVVVLCGANVDAEKYRRMMGWQ
eukprot:TRINITY_DN61152_c0_g1_i1.p1 TRINITY_DN61152_c0_g1~~TRINITY_DN61152_c0_g1_i1.p1  ORF type:complete len:385 (+),score=126.10 TRINITY_DN61152_c0_g1_i1:76-1155(+)